MPRVQFTGDHPQAPPGYELFEPGEVRAVTDEEAAHLTRNVWYRPVEDAQPAPADAGAPDQAPPPAPAQAWPDQHPVED